MHCLYPTRAIIKHVLNRVLTFPNTSTDNIPAFSSEVTFFRSNTPPRTATRAPGVYATYAIEQQSSMCLLRWICQHWMFSMQFLCRRGYYTDGADVEIRVFAFCLGFGEVALFDNVI